MFYPLLPTSDGVKRAQPELLVALNSKLTRTLRHWAAVDAVLPPTHPLVLLEDSDRATSGALAQSLPVLRQRVLERELELVLARAAYERHKGVVHGWVRAIERWVRLYMQWTDWKALVELIPGRGQAHHVWSKMASNTLSMWRMMVADPPDIPVGWPMDLCRGATVEEFAQIVREFELSHCAVEEAKQDLQIARGGLERTQQRATALLMAFGHGVRARLGNEGDLVKSLPELWPSRTSKSKEGPGGCQA